MAADFGDWQTEYRAASTAAVADCSAFTKIELTGRDAVKFLHNLCTNDIKRLEAGRGCEAFLTNAQGKILHFIRVFAGQQSLWIDTVSNVAGVMIAHLDHYRISEKVEMQDRTGEFAQLLFVGARAADFLSAAGVSGLTDLPLLGYLSLRVAGVACTALRSNVLSGSYELRVPAAETASVWQAVWDAGQPYGLRPVGDRAFETLRIEAGWPRYGRDIDESNFPQEVGRTRQAVSFTKGCYLGQETVARIDALGHVNKHLVGLILPAEREPIVAGARIIGEGKVQGEITSSAYSPALGHAIALGYVRRGHDRPGTELSVELPDRAVQSVVASLPLRLVGQ
jgi:folate-binding protein YgfZ